MKKIISLFARNYDGDHLVRDETVPGAEWVVAGEGQATRKFDGTCCMIRGGELYKRYDLKPGRHAPIGFEPAQDADAVTGHHPGWVKCHRDDPSDKWHWQAFDNQVWRTDHILALVEHTFELCGPKVQSDAERVYRTAVQPDESMHVLIPHGYYVYQEPIVPRDFDGLRHFFTEVRPDIEGIVWHHPDGRMVKIKLRDFGLRRQ